jgi:hypothetical protein
MDALSIVSDLTGFGAAGLMGAMWLLERKLSRRREQQITDAHERILRDEQKLVCLTDVVGRNTAAIVRFIENQEHQYEILKHLIKNLEYSRPDRS